MTRLIRIDWPDNGSPDLPPPLSLPECEGRLRALRASAAAQGYDVIVVYGDREHAANLQWLTGFDPRFEEAVLVVTPGDALLLAGNECLAYTAISPLVQAGVVRVGHCSSLSLPSQPRGGGGWWNGWPTCWRWMTGSGRSAGSGSGLMRWTIRPQRWTSRCSLLTPCASWRRGSRTRPT
ncbi:hypothetical protein EI545_08750 [Tabrizicola piscis]|uniref:Creatinase N-terminal domain-containing protein n=1 Tax=Tabrizicola piscis TaxID=2494374 RepID=A0A3S8U5G8_9RHOB|nr:aminopeptidase P family N-terminal domain-containing protein [Tabrizicola piscis]AZL58922.1 hypothetical protein EI545_08750 [Tabrizicola piscis]